MLQNVHLHRPQRQTRLRVDACWKCMAQQVKQSVGLMPRRMHRNLHHEQQQQQQYHHHHQQPQLSLSWQTTGPVPLGWAVHDQASVFQHTPAQEHLGEEFDAANTYSCQQYLQFNQQVQGALEAAQASSSRTSGGSYNGSSKLKRPNSSTYSRATRAKTTPPAPGDNDTPPALGQPTTSSVVGAAATGEEDSTCDSNAMAVECAAAQPSPCEVPPLQQDPGALGSEGAQQFSHGQQVQQQQVLPSMPQVMQPQQDEAAGSIDTPGVRAALAALKWYKSVLSPSMASTCRFQPTCSQYAMDSYSRYGVAKGTVLTAWRLLRCNPWGGSGYDPSSWPPKGLGPVFTLPYSAEVAVVLGAIMFVRFTHALLFE